MNKMIKNTNINNSIIGHATTKCLVLYWLILLMMVPFVFSTNSYGSSPSGGGGGGVGCGDFVTDHITVNASYKLNGGTNATTGIAYTASTNDTGAIYDTNDSTLTLTNPTITTSGSSTSNENSSFYGLNAAVLADGGSTLTINGGSISTTGSGANGAFSYGSETMVNLSNVTIHATGDGGHGVMAVGCGSMTLTNVNQETSGGSSSVIATDRGGGTIIVNGGTAIAHGHNSAALYSTGDIEVTNATLTADGAEAAVIEGSNYITLTDCDLSSTYAGKWGVMLYQSGSGDAEGVEGHFTMTGGSLSYTTGGPLLFNTNSTAYFSLKNVDVTVGSGILLKTCKCGWGNSSTASSGGITYLTADNQILPGNIVIDDYGTVTLTLKNSSSLTGAVNNENKAGPVSITLDSTSKWTATATSYIEDLNGVTLSGGIPANVDTAAGITIHYTGGSDSDGNILKGSYYLTGGGILSDGSPLVQIWYKDADGDGYSDGTSLQSDSRPASNYYLVSELTATSGDCNDNDAAIHPGAVEICDDSKDNNCNGQVDEGCTVIQTWYKDADGDGYSDGTSIQAADSPGSEYYLASQITATSGDCNDNDAAIHPGAAEICGDSIDNDCDGSIDEGCAQNISPPSSLAAQATSSTQMALSWKDNSANEDGFKIERKTGDCSSSSSWTQIATKPAGSTTYTVSGLTPNTAYAFRVRAYQSSSNSAYSNCASAKTGASGTPPAPSNLKATSASATKVNLTWSDNSTNETGFKIYRKIGSGSWVLLKTTGANAKSYNDATATGNSSSTPYQYYIVACNDSGKSPSTNAAMVPYQPTSLAAARGTIAGTVTLTWTDKNSNDSNLEIYRKSGNCSSSSTWTKVATLAANKTSWTDTGLTSANTYAYKIKAYKKTGSILPAYGYSLYSSCASATAP